MAKYVLQKIFNNIFENEKITNRIKNYMDAELMLERGKLCLYIANNYLLENMSNYKILCDYYGTKKIRRISMRIIEDFYDNELTK